MPKNSLNPNIYTNLNEIDFQKKLEFKTRFGLVWFDGISTILSYSFNAKSIFIHINSLA